MPTLAPTPEGIGAARDDARALCERHQIDAGRGDDFVLITSELLGNAVVHGLAPLSYDVSLNADDLLVTVDDSRSAGPPAPRPHDDDAEGGRGLAIVDAVARRWGWYRTASGKRVWARS